jgi:hypothetical protein
MVLCPLLSAISLADVRLLDLGSLGHSLGQKGKLMRINAQGGFVKTIALLAYFAIAFLVVLGPAQAQKNHRSKGVCPWPGKLDGVKTSPETHKVIFENEHVRVLDVTIPPHSKEPVHTHCLPSTLYVQQIGDIIVGDPDGKVVFDSRQMKDSEKQTVPFVLWNSGEGPHWDENPTDVPIKIIQIEQKD